ncbi:MAG: OmpA family protein [Bacteroidetes bacterium]|nr:OmpA family protein [Bacteroidota bacterium]
MKHIALIYLCCATMAVAQDELRPRYGLFAGVGINMHASSFTQLPNVPSCCPGYGSDVAIVPSIMAVAYWPITTNVLLGGRVGYAPLSGTLSRDEATRVMQGGTVVDGMFRHTIEATLNAIAAEPTVSWNAFDQLFVDAGLRVSYMFAPTYAQAETIVSPANGGTYVDASGTDTRSRTRNVSAGDLATSSIHVAVTASLRYELPLNSENSLFLAPDVGVAYGMTSIANVDWSVHPFHAGLTLLWQPQATPEQHLGTPGAAPTPSVPVLPSTLAALVPSPKMLDVGLGLYSVRDDGGLDTLEKIVVDETISEQITAMLPMVFFDQGQEEIPIRYPPNFDLDQFSERLLFGKSALDVYHRILDIVGKRMQEHPAATLTLTGAIMPDSVETVASGLALRRAEYVRDYLQQFWEIAPQRIPIRARELPEQPSSVKHEDGRAENRRVDLASDDPFILDLLRLEDTLRTVTTPDVVVRPTVFSDTTITSWSITCIADGKLLTTQYGMGQPPASIRIPVTGGLQGGTVDVVMTVDNAGGRHREAEAHLPVVLQTLASKAQKRQGLKRIDEYGLILFAFGKASLEGPNARILDMIRQRIEPTSTVIVRGHADRTGSAEINLRLTQERAEAVGNALGAPRTDVRGMGQKNMLYDNDLPEGRYYNRTVRVRVETPVAN